MRCEHCQREIVLGNGQSFAIGEVWQEDIVPNYFFVLCHDCQKTRQKLRCNHCAIEREKDDSYPAEVYWGWTDGAYRAGWRQVVAKSAPDIGPYLSNITHKITPFWLCPKHARDALDKNAVILLPRS